MSDDGWDARIAPVPIIRKGTGRGALAAGVLAVLLSLWPPFWNAAVVCGLIGLVLGIVSLSRTGRGEATNVTTSIGGIAAGVLALALVTAAPIVWFLFAVWSDSHQNGHRHDVWMGVSVPVTDRTDDGWSNLVVEVQDYLRSDRPLVSNGAQPRWTYVSFHVTDYCRDDRQTQPQGSARPCEYGPQHFSVRAKDGRTYSVVTPSTAAALAAGTLDLGGRAMGDVTFDLPDGDYVLEYRSGPQNDAVASWPFTI